MAVSAAAARVLFLLSLTVVAFGLRAAALSTYGFSEDEINKVRAIEQYRTGHFVVNAEHPMLMKLAMWASVEAARAWNRARPGQAVAMEAALRLPNALAGAATTVVLFGLSELSFGTSIAVVAALFWALDVNAIAINRIGKEDTFFVLFLMLAMFCYERAKRVGVADPVGAQRWYTSSGASFGLMLASKYFLHYLGIYALFNTLTDPRPGSNKPHKPRYYGAMLAAFLIGNLAILSPATWLYCLDYIRGGTLMHHGHPFGGGLYVNTSMLSTQGVPATFYLQLVATKIPLTVLGAALAGLIETVRRRRERGFFLIGLLLLTFIVPYSLVAPKFVRYALPLFAWIDIVAAVGLVAGTRWLLRKSWLSPMTRVTAATAAVTLSVVGPCVAQRSASPLYSIYQNAVGERLAPAGATFPEDAYDYGVREAVDTIAHAAEPGAVIISDAPDVVAYYIDASGRRDLSPRALSSAGIPTQGRPSWVIVQAEHLTFENRDVIAQLRRQLVPWRRYYAGDALSAEVFRMSRS